MAPIPQLAVLPVGQTDTLTPSPTHPLPDGSFTLMVVGPPGSGKTNFAIGNLLLMDWAYQGRFDRVYLTSPSLDSFAEPYFLSLGRRVQPHYYPGRLAEILREIQGTHKQVLLVFDDCMQELCTDNSKTSETVPLLANRRHLTGDHGGFVSLIFTAQFYRGVYPNFRRLSSHLVLYPTKNLEELGSIHSEVGIGLGFEDFVRLLYRVWGDDPHQFALIDVGKGLVYRGLDPTPIEFRSKFDDVVEDV